MISFASSEKAKTTRVASTTSGGGGLFREVYLDPKFPEGGEGVFPLPQAFSVEQQPESVSNPHFHDEDQFQVFAYGAGTIGRHDVNAVTVHYANRQTGYGPIVAGDTGVTYFTFRQVATKGIWYLKDAKPDAELPKRNITQQAKTTPAESLKALREAQAEVVIDGHEDGLAAWMVRVPAGATVASPVHAAGSGRYFMVFGGSMRVQGEELPVNSTTFVSHDEKNFNITAGANGLEVLVLQYPGGERVLSRRAKPMSQQGPLKKTGGTKPGASTAS